MRRISTIRLRRSWLVRAAALLSAMSLMLTAIPMPAGAAAAHEQIQASGSSWAFNAVNQWITDVTQQGLQVVFTPSGSAQGRQDFANGVTDFAGERHWLPGHQPDHGRE